MKKLLKLVWMLSCIPLILLFITSCFSSFISPDAFSYISLFAIAFPYIFLAMLIASVINLYINKKLGLAMFICLIPGLYNLSNTIAFNLPSNFSKEKDGSELRVMTWNVQDFVDFSKEAVVSDEMLSVIAQNKPDIICMQELTNIEGVKRKISIRQKMDSLGYIYHFLSNDEIIMKRSYATVTRGCAIFSKIPLTDSGRINISDKTNENLIYTGINFNNKPLRIYTAHLESFGLFRDTGKTNKDIYEITYRRKRAIQYKLRDVEQIHSKESATIRNEISKTSMPIIYCGDMNAVPASYTYHTIKNNLQDAFLAKGSGVGKTFYKIAPTLRIDYLLADKRFKITQCAVISKKLSDHYPVITDMQWK